VRAVVRKRNLKDTVARTRWAGKKFAPAPVIRNTQFVILSSDAAGTASTFYWQASNLGSFINSWNMTSLTVNGVNFTNM
jgi:hypothetical protein